MLGAKLGLNLHGDVLRIHFCALNIKILKGKLIFHDTRKV